MVSGFGHFFTALAYVMVAISHPVCHVRLGHSWSALVVVGHAVMVDIRTYSYAI